MLTTTEERVLTRVLYGIGGACVAELPVEEVESKSVREIILRVAEEPQRPGPAERTAKVLKEVIQSGGRALYVERTAGPAADPGTGEPLVLDHPVPPSKQREQRARTLEIFASEPFRGGRNPV